MSVVFPDPPTVIPSRANQDNATFSAAVDEFLSWVAEIFPLFDDFTDELNNYVTNAYTATSTTSLAIGTGSKAFTDVGTGKSFVSGQPIIATSRGSPNNWMIGRVATYTGGALTIAVVTTSGSGTYTDWDIAVLPDATLPVGKIEYADHTAQYTLQLGDEGIDQRNTTGGWVIPANASVAFEIGTIIPLYNNSGTAQNVTITSDTLRQAGTTNTGTRSVGPYGGAVLRKRAATVWTIEGAGVS